MCRYDAGGRGRLFAELVEYSIQGARRMRALVTGGSYGIGAAICQRLVRDAVAKGERASIVVSATGARPDIHELIDELLGMGAEAKAVIGDLAEREFPSRLVEEAVAFCGGLDALVSNAGARYKGMLRDISIDDWDRMYAVNTRATWQLGCAAHAALRASRGAIVAITSLGGLHPLIGYGPYSTAKAALIMLIEQMANEWAADGIRVNGVAPGSVMTREKAKLATDPVLAARRASAIPLGRVGEPAEVAGAVAFLLGPDASFISGHNLVVDGAFATTLMALSAGSHSNILKDN